jgi:hypothetical protein
MNEFERCLQIEMDLTPLWTNSESAKYLTNIAEVLKHNVILEKSKYHFRQGDEPNTVELLMTAKRFLRNLLPQQSNSQMD